MKNNKLYVKILKLRKDNVFVHILSNIIILVALLSFYLGCISASSTLTATAPIYRGDISEKKVCLMINVYWGEDLIPDIIKVLDNYNADCTFFVGGCWAAKNISMLQEISQKFELGNHGYLHKDHKKLSVQQNTDEIMVCDKLVKEATGIKMTLFAPPSGSIGDNMLAVCKNLDYKVIMWSKDTIDWRDNDYNLVYKRATSGLQNGDLILMHPMAHTLKALPMILEYYAQHDYQAVRVSEIIPPNPSQN